MRHRAVFLVAALSLPPSMAAWAQQPLRVSGTPCTGCVIERQRVLVIAGLDEEMVGPYTILARDSRGRWLLTTMDKVPGKVSIYDATGALLGRFGRKGEGPGEIQGIGAIILTREDSVHIIDPYMRRQSVFSPSYEFIRSVPIIGDVYSGFGLADGSLLMNANYPRSNGVGYPLHLVNASGRVSHSFGATVPQPARLGSHALIRAVTTGDGGKVWTAQWNRYELTLWSLEGKVLEIVRQAPWFPVQIMSQSPGRGLRPTPSVAGIWADGQGQIWVVAHIPDSRWRPPPPEMIPQGERGPPIDYDREYDTMIEIIDTRTGQLLASQRFDQHFRFLMPGGYVIHDREDDDGEPYLDVWKLSFTNPGRR